MTGGGRIGRPQQPTTGADTKSGAPEFVPGRGRAAEREVAAAQIQRTLRVRLKTSGEDADEKGDAKEEAAPGEKEAENAAGEKDLLDTIAPEHSRNFSVPFDPDTDVDWELLAPYVT